MKALLLSGAKSRDLHVPRGMTLLEVIVALTVAGAALATGAAVLGFLTDQQAQSGAQAIASAHAVRTSIREWTAAAQLTTEGDAEFRGADELSFVTAAPTDASPVGTHVRFYMKAAGRDSSQLHGLVAELTPWRQNGAPVVVELAADAIGYRVRYLGSLVGVRTWQPSWISTSVLPVAVELRVLFDSTKGPRSAAHALLSVPMTIPLVARR